MNALAGVKLAVFVFAAALLVAAAVLTLGVTGGLAGELCRGQLVRASWYGAESGSRTASGMAFNGRQWLVAHRSLPFGTKLRLTYRGHSVTVPVEDRGPYIKGRTLDLSRAVAVALGTVHSGVVKLCMVRLK